jgi:hypothetical protein
MEGATNGARILAALRTEVSLVRTVSRSKGLRVILAQIGGGTPKIEHVTAFAQLGYECPWRKGLSRFRTARWRGRNNCETVAALLGIGRRHEREERQRN